LQITHSIGWWWTFYLEAIFCAAALVAIFLFCPETAFRRDALLNTDTADSAVADSDPAHDKGVAAQRCPQPLQVTSPSAHGSGEKKTFAASLALFDGRKTDEGFLRLLLRPLPLLLQPAFLWACLVQGVLIAWTVFIGVMLAAIFLGPPLFWSEVETGYAYVGPFLGAVLGFAVSGALSDWSAGYLTEKNGGIYEPEFRIVLVIPQLLFGCMGLYGFGITANGTLEGRFGWAVPITFFGLEVCGMIIGATASALYIVDAYRDLAIEGFTCILIFKNVFSFGMTFKAYDWLLAGGIEPVFHALATVQLVICLSSIPMYIYGKRNRSFFHRHDILKMTNLR
jgi:hypothetical protein